MPAGALLPGVRLQLNVMDILRGFQLEVPDLFVPWGISESDLRGLLDGYGLQRINDGHYTVSCVSLGGLAHELTFHFFPRSGGILKALEIFRLSENYEVYFEEFQKHFEACFGKPTKEQRGENEFPSCTWDLEGVRIQSCARWKVSPTTERGQKADMQRAELGKVCSGETEELKNLLTASAGE